MWVFLISLVGDPFYFFLFCLHCPDKIPWLICPLPADLSPATFVRPLIQLCDISPPRGWRLPSFRSFLCNYLVSFHIVPGFWKYFPFSDFLSRSVWLPSFVCVPWMTFRASAWQEARRQHVASCLGSNAYGLLARLVAILAAIYVPIYIATSYSVRAIYL